MGFYETENIHFKEVFVMNEMNLDFVVHTKGISKAACAVGFGLTIGKFAGDVVKTAIGKLAIERLKQMAKNGNKGAQEYCDKAKIRYATVKRQNKEEPEMKMGFTC